MTTHEDSAPVIFRGTVMRAAAWACIAFIAVIFGLGATAIGGYGSFGVAIFIAAITYLIWLIGCHSSVRMNHSGMIVDDGPTRYIVPWPELLKIEVRGGMVFVLRGGNYIRMFIYGSSIAGAVTGYRAQRIVAEKMNAARARLQMPKSPEQHPSGYSRKITFSIWPLVTLTILMEAIAALGALAR